MTNSYKKDVKKLNDAVKNLKALDKVVINSNKEYESLQEQIRHANWEIFWAAKDIIRQAIIAIEVNKGMTEESSKDLLDKLCKLM